MCGIPSLLESFHNPDVLHKDKYIAREDNEEGGDADDADDIETKE